MRLVNDSWARRAAAGIWLLALAAAVLVLGTMASARQRVVRAADALVRGEAEGMLRSVDEDFERPPDVAGLQRTLDKFRPAGLRYVAFVEPFDDRACEVGESKLGEPRGEDGIPRDRPGFVRSAERVRLVQPTFRAPPPAHDRPRGPPPPGLGRPRHHPPLVIIELVPTVGDHLAAVFTQAAFVASFAVALLLLFAALLARFTLRAAEASRVAERDRQLRALGEMSSIMAHELRNPMASLKGHAQLLAEDLSGEHRDRAERVVTEAVRLEKLTTELLELVREGPLAQQALSVEELIAAAAAPFVGRDRPRLIIEASDERSIVGDEARLRAALGNVLRNAMDAARTEVRVVVTASAGNLHIDVVDDGQGVAAPDAERIFEPFVTTRTRGTGLGLAIARRVIGQHGGTLVLAEAGLGTGARFRFSLPLARP